MKRAMIVFVLTFVVTSAPAVADGDVTQGASVFKKCGACHSVGNGATNKTGPVLNGVIGRIAGTFEGYNYSQAMRDAGIGGIVWTEEKLAVYLTNPKELVKGNKMSFPGLKKDDEIQNVIAYLRTF